VSGAERSLRARNLRTLAALAGLFLAPLALAFLSYYGSSWRPARHVNHGSLISPARALPSAPLPRLGAGSAAAAGALFHGKWTLAYLGAHDCTADCRQALYLMRQTRLALNNDMTRIERVYVGAPACGACAQLTREYPGLVVLDAGGAAGAALLAVFPQGARAHTLFVIDPLGNLMMSYDAREDPHGLLEDLKKLLRLSHIG
jgi:hypothetical protein